MDSSVKNAFFFAKTVNPIADIVLVYYASII